MGAERQQRRNEMQKINTVDRSVVESAARKLAERIGIDNAFSMEIQWIDSQVEIYYIPGDPSAFEIKSSLWNALRISLRDCACDEPIKSSILNSMWNEEALSDVNWITKFSYAVDVLGAKLPTSELNTLRLYNELAESCSAFQIAHGVIVLSHK